MTVQEFSVEFDILYNNITSGQAPGITEYEKSVFLTQAQESFVTAAYSGKLGEPFEATEEVTEYLRTLIDEFTLFNVVSKEVQVLPKDVWYRTYESVILKDERLMCDGKDTREADVYPVTSDTYYRTKSSPFRRSNSRRVLRLDVNGGFILDSEYNIYQYICRFLKHPNPIILENLGDLSINGKRTVSNCELPEVTHRTILLTAVDLAKNIWKS